MCPDAQLHQFCHPERSEGSAVGRPIPGPRARLRTDGGDKVREKIATRSETMRISVDIDDGLMREAMRCSGARTKKAAVEKGLRTIIAIRG